MILAILQARNGSSRLPGKSMADVDGAPLVERVIRRIQTATLVPHLVVATTDQPEDDALAAHVASLGVPVYRGSATDVLGRCYWAAQGYPDCDTIVRLTADDYAKDGALIDYALTAWLGLWAEQPPPSTGRPEYLHLGGITWPLGLDVEICTRVMLERAHQHATDAADREHVTPWMARHCYAYVLKDAAARGTINTRWTCDTPADLEYARTLYRAMREAGYPPTFGYDDLIAAGVPTGRT